MRHTSLLMATAFALVSSAGIAGAQDGRANRVPPRQGAQRGAARESGDPRLARQLRQQFATVIQRRLNLTDESAKRLQATDRKYEQQRTQLRREERETRLALKDALADSTNVDQAKISRYMDQLTNAARRRADILEAEQKELATFLTPVQRAKLQGLREQLGQRVRQLQQQGGGGGGRRGIKP